MNGTWVNTFMRLQVGGVQVFTEDIGKAAQRNAYLWNNKFGKLAHAVVVTKKMPDGSVKAWKEAV